LLANLFLHYAFDKWMQRIHPDNPFERYADDAIVHCRSEAEASQNQVGQTFRELPSRDQRQSRQGDPQHHQELADPPVDAALDRGVGRNVQSSPSGVDRLLRPILQIEARFRSRAVRLRAPAMGQEEIQTAEGQPNTGARMVTAR